MKNLVRALAAALAVANCGCGGHTVAVHGSVEREGQVLNHGRVVFTPVGGGKPAAGEIQADGSFELATDGTNDGVTPGIYRITVIETKTSDTGKQFTAYLAPNDKSWEILPSASNQIAVQIRAREGWQIRRDN